MTGIHGRPYIPWDNVGTAPGYGGGYCTHTSNLFLPWHRPYLALYEQQLYANVQSVANSFPTSSRARWQAAAKNFRMPYWDWAAAPPAGGKAWPDLISTTYINVQTPTGAQTITNPLLRYEFHPISATDMVYNPFASWTVTKRYPTSWDANASSQNPLILPIMVSNQPSFKDRLYNLFTAYSNFSQFGNEAWISSSTQNADSLESLHDAIHSITGNNGHMTYLDYSAFDPVFWLHHTMIDRCFALWQALYPNSYVQPMAALGATFNFPAGTVESATSPLYPFHKDTKGTNYNSNDVKSVSSFGYTYSELASGKASDVRAAVNKLYGTSSGSSTINKRVIDNSTAVAEHVAGAINSTTGLSNQYICNIVSQKFAMNGSYAIYLFLGNVSGDASTWATSNQLIGTHAVFASLTPSSQQQAKAMGMDMDLKITGTVPLTTALINAVTAGKLRSLKASDVQPYLTANLNWRVAMMDGTEVPVANVPDLSVSVVSATVQPATADDSFPTWKGYNDLINVTAARAGGFNKNHWQGKGLGSGSGSGSSYSSSSSSSNSSSGGSAPYPSGTGSASSPSGTGYAAPVSPTSSVVPFTGAASSLSAGLALAGFGAIAAVLL